MKAANGLFPLCMDNTRKYNGVQSITIHDLNPDHEYWFAVVPGNGCASSTWSNWLKASSEKGKKSIFYRYLSTIINS